MLIPYQVKGLAVPWVSSGEVWTERALDTLWESAIHEVWDSKGTLLADLTSRGYTGFLLDATGDVKFQVSARLADSPDHTVVVRPYWQPFVLAWGGSLRPTAVYWKTYTED